MAFKGDLTNISLFDVLQTLQQNQQSGVLVVQREGITRKIHISPEGVFFSRSNRPLKLGEIFVRRGYVTPEDVDEALAEQREHHRPIGQILIEHGKVTQADVDDILRYHAEDEIYEVFSWGSGRFAFYDGETIGDSPNTGFAEIRLDVSGLCLEAARRLDEMERLRAIIPTNDEYYLQVEGLEPDREQNGPQVCAAFDALTEPNSVDDIRDLVGLSLFDALGVVAQLMEGGLIRCLDVPELLSAGRAECQAGDLRRSAQMLEKAHRMVPDDASILDECIELVERLEDPKRLARLLATRGKLSIGAGDSEEAIELLEHALQQDSGNFATLFALRDAFAQMGDSERAAETSLKLVRAYSEEGNLPQAIEACQTGLELEPGNVPLRYWLGQLLAQADRGKEAQYEIRTLIEETRASKQAMRSERAHELLSKCYRLLLKIDPNDQNATSGLNSLARQRIMAIRKRKAAIWGSIAAAVLLVGLGVGFTVKRRGAASLLARIEEAQLRNDTHTVLDLVGELMESHPESDEARKAGEIRSAILKTRAEHAAAERERQRKLREEFQADLEEVRAALEERPYLEAIGLVQPFLDRLSQPEVKFLRNEIRVHLEFEFGSFLENATEEFNFDKQRVAIIEHQLRADPDLPVERLRKLEEDLNAVRAKDWPKLVPEMEVGLARIAAAPQAGKMRLSIDKCVKVIRGANSAFANLEDLYFGVRSSRLKEEIKAAVKLAQTRGMEHLRRCEFEQARRIYDAAYERADAVADEQPRKHFLELLNWLDKRKTLEAMKRRRNEIDEVVAELRRIEALVGEGKAAEAYRLFRPLVSRHLVIQFEQKYKMPYLVRSTPRGADVFVNDKLVGQSPVAIELDIAVNHKVGRTKVRVARDGFSEAETVLVATDPSLDGELFVELSKKRSWEQVVEGQIEARPVIAGGFVLVATSNANLIALDAKDGDRAWVANTKLLDRITASPVVGGGYAHLITVGGVLHRISVADGTILPRRVRLPGQVREDPTFHDGVLYVVTRNRHLVALRDGVVVYDRPLSLDPATRVLYTNKTLCIGTAQGEVLVHDAATGVELTRLKTPTGSSFFGGLAAHNGLILAGAEDGSLYAFDLETGEQAWRYATAGPVTSSAVSDGSHIFLPARDGYIHALDAEGKLEIQYELSGVPMGAPIVSDRFLYAIDGRRITAFDTSEKVPWWDYVFDESRGNPRQVAAGDSMIVVTTNQSRVVAFPLDRR